MRYTLIISALVITLFLAYTADNKCKPNEHMMSNGMCMSNDDPIMEMNEQK